MFYILYLYSKDLPTGTLPAIKYIIQSQCSFSKSAVEVQHLGLSRFTWRVLARKQRSWRYDLKALPPQVRQIV